MRNNRRTFLKFTGFAMFGLAEACKTLAAESGKLEQFNWKPCQNNPVLSHGAPGTWDENIRERMRVIYEDGKFHGWYGGWKGKYDKDQPNQVHMGYATSDDGIHWTKYSDAPVYSGRWTEDLSIVKSGDTYYMYAEDESLGRTVVHLITSTDKINWTEQGTVLERLEGSDWEGDWVGTPLVWKEHKLWYMLYEGGNPGDIGLATSTDGIHWKRSQKRPVLPEGRGWEDEATAPDSILKKNGIYYLFYHAQGKKWQTGLATSKDLVNWTRFSGNPILPNTSPVIVETPDRYFMYTTDDTDDPRGMIYAYTSMK